MQSLSDGLETTHVSSPPQAQEQTQRPSSVSAIPSSLPASSSRSFDVNGVRTDAYAQAFADRLVIGVTQLDQRIGNYITCQASRSPIDGTMSFALTTVLGDRADPMLGVYARRITEKLLQLHPRLLSDSARESFGILLGISLKKDQMKETEVFHAIVDELIKLVQTTIGM